MRNKINIKMYKCPGMAQRVLFRDIFDCFDNLYNILVNGNP